MRAVMSDGAGNVTWRAVNDPVLGPGEVLLEVAAAGVNRADLLQAIGAYPPPPGVSDALGLECSGRIVDVGFGVTGWRVGDAACALLPGGAQAELAAVPAGLLAPVPAECDIETAGALPEAAATAWSNLVMVGRLRAGQWVIIHGGAGGIGSFAIQLARSLGAHVIATAGSAERAAACRAFGAEMAIDYRGGDFVMAARDATDGVGVDLVLDVVGAEYLEPNLKALKPGGRLVVIGMQRGSRGEIDLGLLLSKRAAVIGTTVRSRPLAERSAIMAAVAGWVWPLIGHGIAPVIDERIPMSQPQRAHDRLRAGGVRGKLVLTVP